MTDREAAIEYRGLVRWIVMESTSQRGGCLFCGQVAHRENDECIIHNVKLDLAKIAKEWK